MSDTWRRFEVMADGQTLVTHNVAFPARIEQTQDWFERHKGQGWPYTVRVTGSDIEPAEYGIDDVGLDTELKGLSTLFDPPAPTPVDTGVVE